MPQFTVVIPVYNKASTLEGTLASVYGQACQDLEIVAVDDGSRDGSRAILRAHEREGRLRVLERSAPGPGGYAARNHGVAHAYSPWIAFLDADDRWFPTHLSRLDDGIRAHPDLSLFVGAHAKRIGGRDHVRDVPLKAGRVDQRACLAAIGASDFVHMGGVCVRRETFLRAGGFPEGRFRRGGDVYLWFKLLCSLPAIHYDPEVTSVWVQDSRQVSTNPANLTGLEPTTELLTRGEVECDGPSLRLLKTAINRKILTRAIEKKQAGHPIGEDLATLYPSALTLRQGLYLASLGLPARALSQIRAWRARAEASTTRRGGDGG